MSKADKTAIALEILRLLGSVQEAWHDYGEAKTVALEDVSVLASELAAAIVLEDKSREKGPR